MVKEHPKVFISHASEDKERFVLGFGEKLRSNGIDAWVDKWEIKPGDKLVEKIFEDGINKADAFIIVLSENSVNKKWVREELDIATIRRIEENTRIIPIVIDDSIKIPAALKHIKWITIDDLSNYDEYLESIVTTVFGMDTKPPLNSAPTYVNQVSVPNLTKIDSIVIKSVGDILMERGKPGRIVTGKQILTKLDSTGIPEEEISNSIEILESQFYLKITHTTGGIMRSPIQVTPSGFLFYAENFLEDFNLIYKDVISKIINDKIYSAEEISEKIEQPRILVDSIMEFHESLGDINLQKAINGYRRVYRINATGKRKFKGILED